MKKIKLLFMLLLTFGLAVVLVQPLNLMASDSTQSEGTHIEYDVNGDGEINYVAFGDSTSNGYGLGDYYLRYQKHYQEGHVCDQNCVLRYGPITTRTDQRGGNNLGYLNNAAGAYPSLLANKLEDATGKNVNLLNMAISGMRIEELRLLLDKEYLGDGYTRHRFFEDKTIAADAYSYFVWANNLTFNDAKGFVPEYAQELRDAVTAEYGTIDANSEFYVDYPNAASQVDLAAAKISADYHYAVSNADVISIALGTNNFGTASETSIYRALASVTGLTLGTTTDFDYDMRDLLTDYPELVDYYVQFKPVIQQILVEQLGQDFADKYYDALIDLLETYSYGLIGFIANYIESINLIKEINPNVKIVLIPAFNLEDGLKFVYNGTLIDFGNIYGKIIELANLWLSMYATSLPNVSYTNVDHIDVILDEVARGEINTNVLSTMTGDLADNFAGGSQQVMQMIADAFNALEYGDVKFTGNIQDPADQQVAGQMLGQYLYVKKGIVADNATIGQYLTYYGIAATLRDAIIVAASNESVNMDEMIETLTEVGGFNIGALIMDQNGNMDPAKLYDETVQDLLYVFVRMMFAAGAGVHPSAVGHQTIADSVFNSMEAGFDTEVKIQRAFDNVKAMIEYFVGELPELEEIKATLEAKLNELCVAYPELQGYLDQIEYYTAQLQTATKEEVVQFAKQKLAELKAKVEAVLVEATSTEYVYDENSYYVSLGDSQLTGHGLPGYSNYGYQTYVDGSAPYEIAKELFGTNAQDHYIQLSMGGFRTEDLLWILNPNHQPDEYSLDYTANNLLAYGGYRTVEEARQVYVSELRKADLVTLSIGGGNVSTFVGQQIKLYMNELTNPYEMDWSRYVGAENVQYVEQALQLMMQGLNYVGLPATIDFLGRTVNTKELIALAVESFIYGYVGYTVNYTKLLETIKAINPTANIVIVGYFNPVRGMNIPMTLENGTTINIPVSEMTEYMMKLSSAQNLAHAVLSNEKVTYVSITDTVTFLDEHIAANGAVSLMTYLDAIYNNSAATHASAAGHEYIKNQILNAINASHVCAADDDGDCSTEVVCGVCGDVLVEAKEHTYDNTCDTTCNNDGCSHERTITHTPGTEADCENDQVCTVCGEVLVPAHGHLYGAPAYTWTIAGNGYDCTATLTCVHNNSHVIVETVSSTYSVSQEATCEQNGIGVYTSDAFQNSAFTVQTKEEIIRATGHNWQEVGYVVENGNHWYKVYTCTNNGEEKKEAVSGVVAGIGNVPYASLADAYNAAVDGDTITLYQNITLNDVNGFAIDKELTIDFNQHTVEFTTKKAFRPTADVTFKNGTILNNTAQGRCINLRATCNVVVENMTLNASASYNTQPITVGVGSGSTVTVVNSTIDCGNSGYGIIVFAENTTLNITDSTLTGYGLLYFKHGTSGNSAGSVANVVNSTLYSKNIYTTDTNNFSAIIIDDSNVTVNVDSTSTITVETTGNQQQAIVGTGTGYRPTGYNVYLDSTITLTGEKAVLAAALPCQNEIRVLSQYASLLSSNWKVNNDGTYVTAEYNAHHVEVILPAVDPTCTQTGLTEGKKCSDCGEIYVPQEIVAALGHTEVVDAAVDPTCTQTGLTEGKHCSVCNEVLVAQEVVAALGHTYTTVVTPPTCVDAGYTTYTCTVCGDVKVDDHVPALGHNYTTVVTPPTCVDAGYTTYTCTVCSHSYVSDHVSELGHNYTTVVTPPTCVDAGYTTYTCTVCSHSYVSDHVSELGHDYSIHTVTPPTCEEDGYTTHSCSRCGDSYIDTPTEATGHNYNTSVVTPPTCTQAGYTTYTCANCGGTYKDDFVGSPGHNYVAVVTNPTCLTAGYTTYTCSVCGDSYVDNRTNATGHSVVVDSAVAPTCTQTGLTEGSHCSVCNTVIAAQTVLPAKGHSYTSVVTPATCTTAGYTTHTCSVCHDSYQSSHVPATGHSYNSVVTPATCTTAGYTTHTCSVCHDSYVDSRTNALGHRAVVDVAVAPTCTQTGLSKGSHCSVCGTTIVAQTVIPANGHSAVVDKAVAATCTQPGLTEGSHCSVCSEVLEPQTVVNALGHSYSSVVTDPTCTEAGYTTHTCSICGDSYEDTRVNALGHTLTHVEAVEPNCQNMGSVEHWHCSVCNKNYADQNATSVLSDVNLPVSSGAHVDRDGDNKCDICDKRIAKKSCRKGSVFTFFSFILTTAASCFVLIRRKR